MLEPVVLHQRFEEAQSPDIAEFPNEVMWQGIDDIVLAQMSILAGTQPTHTLLEESV